MIPRDLVHGDGQREGVRRIHEERVTVDLHLVEEEAFVEVDEPERLGVGDEVDLVTAVRELKPQLGRHGPGAAERRVTGDSDLHRLLHSLSTSSARCSIGSVASSQRKPGS